MTRNDTAGMILADPTADNRIGDNYLMFRDARVPSSYDFHDNEPTPAGSLGRVAPGPNGECVRHLFDVLHVAIDIDDPDEDEDEDYAHGGYRAPRHLERFRSVMTCVNCGYVEQWTGTREREFHQLEPRPLVAGRGPAQLRAQEVTRVRDTWGGFRCSSFHVFNDAGARVGVMTWARGPRGRYYYSGALSVAGADGEYIRKVEGPTPAAALTKLAKVYAATLAA